MNPRKITLEYLGWCPGVESAARFIPDKELSEKVILLRITGGVLGFILLGVFLSGVPVPARSPYIDLMINVDQETYSEEGVAIIEYRIVNKMPFKIKLKPFGYREESVYRYNEGGKELVSSHLDDVPPQQGEIGLVFLPLDSTNMGGYSSYHDLPAGEYVVYLNIEGYQVQRYFQVK
ncbi:hypothetical protein GF319_13210 [Candidatus Bathyarchaeota archaeon]|nr:hypothetical protein [Candidatus Bathyarchaeota archaeon]